MGQKEKVTHSMLSLERPCFFHCNVSVQKTERGSWPGTGTAVRRKRRKLEGLEPGLSASFSSSSYLLLLLLF